ncbi:HEPN domain-containing protein [uncultured Pseudokineococcus sp.]|uniref:ApeA N-terminal domain 1-containing protein n=1 Tax=uncultured Pseudokineococcus sp. TaxID=1642928 RepID=UPI002637BCE1|nr:HEPN domain-containing protein [uncultured Pseudokineococcus sp.]
MDTSGSHRIKGWWFLPDLPESRIPGVLTWSAAKGAELELFGGLHGVGQTMTPGEADTLKPEVDMGTIYGETDAGKRVTLWDAERRNYKSDLGGATQEEFWHSPWLCIGSHMLSADDRSLQNLQVAVDNLYYLTGDGRFSAPVWVQMEGVDHPVEEQSNGTFLTPYAIPVVGGLKADVATGSTPRANYSICTDASRPWISPATEAMPELKLQFMTKRTRSGPSITLRVNAWARISPVASPISARDFLYDMHPLLALLSLATFARSGVEWMTAVNVDGEEVSLLCHFAHPGSPGSPAETNIIFDFSDVSLDSFLQAWERLGDGPQARYARNMAVGQVGHTPVTVEEHVGQVLAVAEGFHRWCLKGGKSVTLKDRLLNLHDRLPDGIRRQLNLEKEKQKWVDWAVWARNNVDHGGAEKHREVADFYHLKVIADSVWIVTYLAALQDIGVPTSSVEEALRNHPRLRVLAERCADLAKLPES